MNINDHFKNYRDKPCDRFLIEVLKEAQFLIFGVVFKIVSHKQDAEDLTQEVLIKVIQNINLLPNNTNFIGWLSKVSLNTAINHYQQKKRTKTLLTGYQEIQNNQNFENEEEKLAIIYQHLATLEEVEQSMVINKHINQMTISQLGSLYQLPDSTIELKIKKIINKLKNSIEKAGFAGVALGLSSTFDQIQATDISVDLIPKIKEHLPATYPKATLVSTKILMGVLAVVASLAIFLGIDYLPDSKSSMSPDSVNSTLTKNNLKTPIQTKKKEITQENLQKSSTKISQDNEDLPTNLKSEQESDVNPEQNKANSISTEYAGQLLDAITKAPIADAKLEIWDIYTYEKTETKTDAEGKYNVPPNVDTTFFCYLKFFKEGYAVKQTFQHFDIHSKISIYMNKGGRLSCTLQFEESTKGEIYLGSFFEFADEKHLTTKHIPILNRFLYNAPLKFYTLIKIKLENVTEYSLNEIFEHPDDSTGLNFIIFRDGTSKSSVGMRGIANGGVVKFKEESKYKLISLQTGKILANTKMKIFDRESRTEYFENSDNGGSLSNFSKEILKHSILTIGDYDYFASSPSGPYSFPFDYSASDILLKPFIPILFDPMTMGDEFKNMQVLLGSNECFSMKSAFKKTTQNKGNIIIMDRFFEKTLYQNLVNVPFGGLIDINAELNTAGSRNLNLKISIGDQILKNLTVLITLFKEDGFEFNSFQKIQLDENGIGSIKIPNMVKKIKVEFSVNKTNAITYVKLIELDQLQNDSIALNFNKKLEIQIESTKDLKLLALSKITKKNPISGMANALCLSNDNTLIELPISKTSIYVEKDIEYKITDCGFGIKTNMNQTQAINMLIKSHINQVEVKPVTDLDYTSAHFDIHDEKENKINDLEWMVVEDRPFSNMTKRKLNSEFLYKSKTNFEFSKPSLGADLDWHNAFTVGEESIKNKTIQLLNNRNYTLYVKAKGFNTYIAPFSTNEKANIEIKVTLKKPNSIIFRPDIEFELFEILNVLKPGDIINEYDNQKISNLDSFKEIQRVCKKEKVSIKIIRDNMPMEFMIPSFQIFGVEDNYYENKGVK